jgi:hypothetical protein
MTTNVLTREALARKRANGERTGEIPFGWNLDGGRLVEDAAEQQVRREIFALRNAGWSLRQIARHLAKHGAATKKGGQWYAGTVRSILANYRASA